MEELIGLRNNKYYLRGNDILKLPKANTTTYVLKSWRFTKTLTQTEPLELSRL